MEAMEEENMIKKEAFAALRAHDWGHLFRLFDLGLSINFEAPNGLTPLLQSVSGIDTLSVTVELINKKATLDLPNKNGEVGRCDVIRIYHLSCMSLICIITP